MMAGEFARRRARIESDRGEKCRPRGNDFSRRAMRALAKRAHAALIVPNGKRIGYRLPDGGVACDKQRFRSEGSANAELRRIGAQASHDYIPVRSYLCDWCGGWHLTSRPR